MEIKDKIERVKVQDLKYYPDNPRKHSKDQIEKLAKQIKQVGFNQPIIIDEDNQVLVGNGRLEAADHLNMEELPCIRYSELTQLQKKQLILADNKLNDLSEWEGFIVGEWLNELVEGDMDAYFSTEEMTELWDDPKILGDEAFGNLPEGEKSKLEQITFTLDSSQSLYVKACLTKAQTGELFEQAKQLNDNKNGCAIWAICKEWEKLKN